MRGHKSSAWPYTSAYTDFWSLVNFWKHYMPYQPRPTAFDRESVRDFRVHLGDKAQSSLVLRDLVKPVFNCAVRLAGLFAVHLSLPAHFVPQSL